MDSDGEFYILNINLVVKLGSHPMGQLCFGVNREGDLHMIIVEG